MIKVKKYSDPNESVIHISYLILKNLKKKRIINLEELRKKLSNQITSLDYLFIPSLIFLYAIGKIEYHPKNDIIEYIEN